MAQRLVTSFINTNIPGAYPNITVKSNPVALGASGICIIIGEADGGDSYKNVALKDNSYTPDQLDKVQQTYLSGQIVDAFRAFSAPSSDADISGSANRIFIVKTNQGAKASALVDTSYGTLSDQNWGLPGNQYKFQVTSTAAESAPTVTSGTIAAFGAALNGATFDVRLNGLAATTVTLSGTAGDHSSAALLAAEIDAQLPAGMSAVAGSAPSTIVISVDADAAAYRKGWGKAFELVDTSADLASLGLAPGQTNSAQEPAIEIAINRADIGLNEEFEVAADVALSLGYLGTTATVTVTDVLLTTTITGGAGANLSLTLANFRTLSDVADFINNQPGYSASVTAAAQQLVPQALDNVSAVGIATSVAGLKPGRIKKAARNFEQAVVQSRGVQFAPTANAGLPAPMALPAFLAGGTRGVTLAADIIDAVNQMAGVQANIIVPLFSQDASADVTAGVTASGSTYTIDAVHAAVKSHCIQYSTPKLKKNRLAILSQLGAYGVVKAKAQSLAHYRCSLTVQSPTQINSQGNITVFQPWYAACVAAGMQAGGFYKSITNKFANVIAFADPTGFDSGSPGDVEDALDAGLMILTKDTAGNRWVSDQTTYGFDTNFVYNSLQAVYCSDILALDLADSFQKAFVGKSLADVDAATALGFLAQKMDGYKKIKLIAASDDAPLGYKNAKVSIVAPEMDIAVEVKLATAIYFVPIDISLSQVQSAAAQ